MLTISALARRFGLSRSALLHYDRIGLLRPSGRSAKDHRRYSEADAARLEAICTYRRAGLPLEAIGTLLSDSGRLTAILRERLVALEGEMATLRGQQRLVAGLLREPDLLEGLQAMDKATWVALLRASGFTEADMDRWHEAFERTAPDRHQRFLAFLGIPPGEISGIRNRAAASGHPSAPGGGSGSGDPPNSPAGS
ncbi:MAG: MerR family transcriptional regulator [Holophagaceae bacterium]